MAGDAGGDAPSDAVRLAMRERPRGVPVMRMKWGSLLFAHWPIDAALLRPLVPSRLSIDTFGGTAWIGVIPFTMWGVRASFLPAFPWLSAFHELNVRTYVHLDGADPGVWFFSLDAANPVAVAAARASYHLRYCNATMSLTRQGEGADGRIIYKSRRTHLAEPPAEFEATWMPGAELPPARDGSIDSFLTERYCLYAAKRKRLYRARIHHEPWRLRSARVDSWRSTMVESLGLPEPSPPASLPPSAPSPAQGGSLLHHADFLEVDAWLPERV